jgi:hypothetical protein
LFVFLIKQCSTLLKTIIKFLQANNNLLTMVWPRTRSQQESPYEERGLLNSSWADQERAIRRSRMSSSLKKQQEPPTNLVVETRSEVVAVMPTTTPPEKETVAAAAATAAELQAQIAAIDKKLAIARLHEQVRQLEQELQKQQQAATTGVPAAATKKQKVPKTVAAAVVVEDTTETTTTTVEEDDDEPVVVVEVNTTATVEKEDERALVLDWNSQEKFLAAQRRRGSYRKPQVDIPGGRTMSIKERMSLFQGNNK